MRGVASIQKSSLCSDQMFQWAVSSLPRHSTPAYVPGCKPNVLAIAPRDTFSQGPYFLVNLFQASSLFYLFVVPNQFLSAVAWIRYNSSIIENMSKHILLFALVLGSLFAGLGAVVEEAAAAGLIEEERAPEYDERQAQAGASEQLDQQEQEEEEKADEAMDQAVIKALPLVNVDSQRVRQVYVGGNAAAGWGCCNGTMTMNGAHIHKHGRKFKSHKPRSLFRHVKKRRKL